MIVINVIGGLFALMVVIVLLGHLLDYIGEGWANAKREWRTRNDPPKIPPITFYDD